MPVRPVRPLALGVLAAGLALTAQSSEYPLALNLPTVDRMQYWDMGVAFTHRFQAPVKDNGKDLYGLDRMAFAGFGFAIGIKPIPGLNFIATRSALNKTVTLGFQQQLFDKPFARMAFRAERFDEVVPHLVQKLGGVQDVGEIGIFGGCFQLPTEFFLTDDIILTVVPTYVTRTPTSNFDLKTATAASPTPVYLPDQAAGKKGNGVFNTGVGLRVGITEAFSFMGEYYPKPSRLPSETYRAGFALGLSYKTFKHRFSLMGTNVLGTTGAQVLSGDYADSTFGNGPRSSRYWSLGFNITRMF